MERKPFRKKPIRRLLNLKKPKEEKKRTLEFKTNPTNASIYFKRNIDSITNKIRIQFQFF